MQFHLLPAVISIAFGLLPTLAFADGDEDLGPSFNQTIVGGGVAIGGIGLAARSDGMRKLTGDINLFGVPPGANVHTAWLYWSEWYGNQDAVVVNGSPVIGTLIGSSADTFWGSFATLQSYRADVTSIVAGNGTYSVSGLPSSPLGADTNGAGLVVVYENAANNYAANIVINDGARTWCGAGAITETFDALDVAGTPTLAAFGLVVGDGQPLVDSLLTFEGAAQAPLLDGAFGSMWDMELLDVTALVGNAQTQADWSFDNTGDDCLHFVAAFLETRVPVTPGTPDMGPGDTGAGDAGIDMGPGDTGIRDAGTDMGSADFGIPDAGTKPTDTGTVVPPDSGVDTGIDFGRSVDVGADSAATPDMAAEPPDTGGMPLPDAGAASDAGSADAALPPRHDTPDEGCCSTAAGGGRSHVVLLLIGMFAVVGRRRSAR